MNKLSYYYFLAIYLLLTTNCSTDGDIGNNNSLSNYTSSLCDSISPIIFSNFWLEQPCYEKIKQWNDANPDYPVVPPTAYIDACPVISKGGNIHKYCPDDPYCPIKLPAEPNSETRYIDTIDGEEVVVTEIILPDGDLPDFEQLFLRESSFTAENDDMSEIQFGYENCEDIFSFGSFKEAMSMITPMDVRKISRRWIDKFDVEANPSLIQRSMATVFDRFGGWTYCNSLQSNNNSKVLGIYHENSRQIVLYNSLCRSVDVYGQNITHLEAYQRYLFITSHELGHLIDHETGMLTDKDRRYAREPRATMYGIFVAECAMRKLQKLQYSFIALYQRHLQSCSTDSWQSDWCKENRDRININIYASECMAEVYDRILSQLKTQRLSYHKITDGEKWYKSSNIDYFGTSILSVSCGGIQSNTTPIDR
ncbi:hypothetical protein [Lewinella sp. JB7]|uniref:hypothetical protein n=1 Tax=Lewinella sp. JB7 TaxID=2962887 RepID=UPI0020C9C2A9|nr:hypothetical protein [Lewinella sp. JB7]MCP9237717.1 hypothetical protein [Lewinella sp. JB7]